MPSALIFQMMLATAVLSLLTFRYYNILAASDQLVAHFSKNKQSTRYWKESKTDSACTTEILSMAPSLIDATRDCDVVVYTTVFFYETGAELPDPKSLLNFAASEEGDNVREDLGKRWNSCFVLMTSDETAFDLTRQYNNTTPWVIIPESKVRYRSVKSGSTLGDGRRASRVAKMIPHVLFPNTFATVYFDWKLTLTQHPFELVWRTLMSANRSNAGFVAFRHPCTTSYTTDPLCVPPQSQDGFHDDSYGGLIISRDNEAKAKHVDARRWWYRELNLVVRFNKTSDVGSLKRQQKRYLQEDLAMQHYPDAGVLIRATLSKSAQSVNCMWLDEYSRPQDSSDRDQPALAAIFSRHFRDNRNNDSEAYVVFGPSLTVLRPKVDTMRTTFRSDVLLLSEGPLGVCGHLCHWYEGGSVAKKHRKRFIKKEARKSIRRFNRQIVRGDWIPDRARGADDPRNQHQPAGWKDMSLNERRRWYGLATAAV